MDVEPIQVLPTREELLRQGFAPKMVAHLDALREEHLKSGLSFDAFTKQLQRRADAAMEKVERRQRGWTTPILGGFMVVSILAVIGMGIHTKRDVGLLVTVLGASAPIYFLYNPDNPPPRRRLIGGLLIGAAIGGLAVFVGTLL